MPHELKGREIFAVGKWNNMEFTDADLVDIVDNFDNLKETHKVPLKFGHDADHSDGQPAIGWISRVFKEGNKLFADFRDMPRVVFEAIKNKLYRTVSIELLFNVDSDGKKFNHVLDAVALLGADRPAVSTLADLDRLLATRTAFSGGHRVSFETTAGTGKKLKKDKGMDKEEVQALIKEANQPLVDANAQLTKDNKALKEANAQFTLDKTEADDKAKKDAITFARKNVTEVLDAAVKAKSLTPAFREIYEKQIGVADDARVVEIKLEEVKSMFKIEESDDKHTGFHKDGDDELGDDPEGKLLSLVYKNQAETGKDFKVSFAAVSAANPELHKAYLDLNGEVGQ